MEEETRERSMKNQQEQLGARGELASMASDIIERSLEKGFSSKKSSENIERVHNNASHGEDQPYKKRRVNRCPIAGVSTRWIMMI